MDTVDIDVNCLDTGGTTTLNVSRILKLLQKMKEQLRCTSRSEAVGK